MKCTKIRNLIDRAERPDLLGHEIERHTTTCEHCRRFAEERLALRVLLGSPGRVGAPSNFDMMLRAKLAAHKSRRSPWVLVPASYMRMAGVAAVLLVAFVGGQTFLPQERTSPETQEGIAQEIISHETTATNPPVEEQAVIAKPTHGSEAYPQAISAAHPTSIKTVGFRGAKVGVNRPAIVDEERFQAEKVLLLRGKEIEFEFRRVSQGAELPYYSSMLQGSAQVEKTFY